MTNDELQITNTRPADPVEVRTVVDDLSEVRRVITIKAGEHVRYLLPIVGGVAEPRQREVVLAGEGARVEIIGAVLGQGSDTIPLTLDIVHAAGRTRSQTHVRALLDGAATLNLTGTVRITADGHGADAFLEERALLLSPNASASTIPALEILANDVRCKHAAAAGPVDPEHMFYLRSRGLSEAEAQSWLVRGFLAPILDAFDTTWQNQFSRAFAQLSFHV